MEKVIVSPYKIRRVILGKKQREVAEEAGISQRLLSQVENGLRTKPEVIARLNKILGMKGGKR